jgi:hypothetical protein
MGLMELDKNTTGAFPHDVFGTRHGARKTGALRGGGGYCFLV